MTQSTPINDLRNVTITSSMFLTLLLAIPNHTFNICDDLSNKTILLLFILTWSLVLNRLPYNKWLTTPPTIQHVVSQFNKISRCQVSRLASILRNKILIYIVIPVVRYIRLDGNIRCFLFSTRHVRNVYFKGRKGAKFIHLKGFPL